MFIQHRYPGHLFSAPRSFASLMELYEQNYIALRRLCPRLPAQGEHWVSAPQGAPRLYLSLIEHTRYTSSLELTHRFDAPPDDILAPSLSVRIYHDARQAEVLMRHGANPAGSRHPAFGSPDGTGELRARWSANRFLNRWLHYCLGQGHTFSGGRAARAGSLVPTAE
ncbi:DUF1249 domain-containing protein [Acidihalobacter prosperus]|uniref:DUF1249 domain-containing protein n=1 Tax=Acidihalobacter prosperus TaxID=160660 RepID=A0A1A6C833_9GAMM|nr:DUF1249 domain-containing protein [Acidihalobacter prosperus]OBS10728.1 hypothetical protein Thpro_020444 [Acidihalobacter prosperus]